MKNLYLLYLIGIIYVLPGSLSKVQLKSVLRPPMATLVCLISSPSEDASVILMCPSDKMCFQNCVNVCQTCSNNISCSYTKIGPSRNVTYVFNYSNPSNQGEWECHYGSEKGATEIYYEPPIQEPKEQNNISKTTLSKVITLLKGTTTTVPVTKESQNVPISSLKRSTYRPLLDNVNPVYVIILLVVFSISLLINIIFLMRDLLTNISTKKFINCANENEYSCWLSMCIKLFCVEKLIKRKQTYQASKFCQHESNPLLSRQVSSNIYEYPIPFLPQNRYFMENFPFLGTPVSDRSNIQSNYIRSKSFPIKQDELSAYSPDSHHLKILNQNGPHRGVAGISTSEISNPIIYDDVADPSTHYGLLENQIYFRSLVRPNHRLSRHMSLLKNHKFEAMSMNNLDIKSKYPSDTVIKKRDSEETLLKDAITSRVELSKEMINQADNLLKQADNLLNRKESPNNS